MALAFRSIYNVYNILAAYAACRECGVEGAAIADTLSSYILKNGRMQTFTLGQHHGILLTSKHENSIAYDTNLRYIASTNEDCTVLIIVDAVSRKYFTSETSWLWDIDFDWQGFEWLVPDDNHNNVVVFLRRDQAGNELLCAVNFSPNDYENYRVGVPPRKRYVPAFTTDAPEFGGSGFADTKPLTVKDTPSHGKEQSVTLRLPAFGAVFLRGEGSFTKRGSATKVKKVKNRKRS